MSLPGRVGSDPCRLAQRWFLDSRLATLLVDMDAWAAAEFRGFWPGLTIISGPRTEGENRDAGGSPNSFHLRCPSLAADLRVGSMAGLDGGEIWAILGGWWRLNGGRWGGTFKWEGSPLPNPEEWNHFDLG